MKKVFLINFSTTILRDVVLELKKRGIEATYWQGYRDDFESFRKDKDNFPNTIFHHCFDATKNIPPAGIDVSKFEPPSKEIIEKLYQYGWQALAMIGRADYLNLPFTKKRNVYYQYIKFWHGMLKKFQPDAILFTDIPHSAAGHTLYSLAKALSVKTIMLDQLTIESRALLVDDYKESALELLKYFKENESKDYKVENLSADIKDYYLQQLDSNIDSTPLYQKTAYGNAPMRLPKYKIVVKHIFHFTFFKTALAYLGMLFTKRRMGIINDNILGIKFKLIANKWRKVNKSSEKEYIKLQSKPDLTKKFIYVPLNHQPEKTTCPMGGVFDDQILMIDILASSLPDGWVIYVKEHTKQWGPGSVGSHLYRYKDYYQQIAKFKNTYLAPVNISSYDLINKAQAVATATGTAGWEAIMRSKPALVFGYIWYMYCEGAFKVSDADSCRQAINKIAQGYKIDQQKVINFLAALDNNSIRARDYKTRNYKQNDIYVSREDNVKNLSEAFYQAIL